MAFFSVYGVCIWPCEEECFIILVIVVPEIKLGESLAVYSREVGAGATVEALQSKQLNVLIRTFLCIRTRNMHLGG